MASLTGLVESVTTVSVGHLNPSLALSELNKRRRIRRMRRVVIASAEAARSFLTEGGSRYACIMVTLTYREEVAWQPQHIAEFRKAVVQRATRAGVRIRFQWVIELTQRGKPHYHALLWVPFGYRIAMPDRNGDWKHGSTRVETARKPVGYITKYATKGSSELYQLPKHARLFGVGGGLCFEKHVAHRAGLPMWLDSVLLPEARGRRVARVGWVCSVTAEIFSSPFEVGWSRDSWGIVVVTITRRGSDAHPNC